MKNEPPKIDRCPCGAFVPGTQLVCTDCQRRKFFGSVIERLLDWYSYADNEYNAEYEFLDVLDALTWTWTMRKLEVIQRRREANEEAKAQDRTARESYYAGREDGRRGDPDFW